MTMSGESTLTQTTCSVANRSDCDGTRQLAGMSVGLMLLNVFMSISKLYLSHYVDIFCIL